ncbi:MAG: hypothetical protein WC648_03290 [Candidatus Paceibacterota bacterium]|jgi:hypothetical protein
MTKFKKTVLVSVVGMSLCAIAGIAYATVGGPTLVYDMKYDTKTNSIYFTEQDFGGKGCPPELKAISVKDNVGRVVLSCDDGLAKDHSKELIAMTENFAPLIPVSLKKNGITASIEAVGVEKIEEDWIIKTNFIAHIFQDNKNVANIPISGCNLEQPFIIDGYRIPGQMDKMVLLVSTKGDCFEGGYIRESLNVISGVKQIEDSYTNTYKTNSPLVPNDGSLIIYAKASSGDVSPSPTDNDQELIGSNNNKYSSTVLVICALIALILGVLIGRSMKVRTSQ